MPTPTLAYHLEVETLVEDVPCRIGIAYRHYSGATAAYPCLDLVNKWADVFRTLYKNCLSSSALLMRIMAHSVAPSDDIPYEANYDSTNVGARSAESMPPSIALLVKLQTSSVLSRNNGHIYISGMAEDDWVSGVWRGAALTAVDAFMEPLSADLPASAAGAVYRPCVISRWLAGVKRTPPITYDLVNYKIRTTASQQRKRLSGQQGIKA